MSVYDLIKTRTVTHYETTDGQSFSSASDAEDHQAYLSVLKWVKARASRNVAGRHLTNARVHIMSGFDWYHTPEGYGYWSGVYNKLGEMKLKLEEKL